MLKKGLLTLIISSSLTCPVFASQVNNECINIFNLKNGHTVIIKENHSNPIVAVDTWIRTGSINENDKNNGVAHFLEHLFFKGTKNHKQGEFEKILDSKGGKYNAATSKDFTHFYITIASQYFDTALNLQSDMLLHPAIPIEDLNRERKVVQEEIGRAEDNPNRILYKNLNDMLFKVHPYRYEVLGTRKNIQNISREEIFNFYHSWYNPSNMVTIVVGDVNTDDVLKKIQSRFKENINSKPKAKIKYVKEPFITKAAEKIAYGNYNSGYMLVGFKTIGVKDKKDSYALDVAASILGDGKTSRLYQELKEKKRLVNIIGASNSTMKDDGMFVIEANFEPAKYEQVKTEIFNQLQKLRKEKVTCEELNRVKTQYERSFLYSNESVEGVAGSIGYNVTVGGDISYYRDYVNDIKKITAEDVQNAVNKYLLNSKSAVSMLLPENSKAEKPVSNTVEISPEKQAVVPNISNQTKTDNSTCEETKKQVLANGIQLITDKNTSNDIISLRIFFKGGNFTQPIPGIATLVSETLLKGTKNRTALQIAEELENSGIEINPVANADYFEIGLKSISVDFDKAFEILADIIQNPAFNTTDIKKAQKDIIEGIKSKRDNPQIIAFEEYVTAMYPNRVYGHSGKILEKTIPTINREDVINYYNKYFIPQNMIISVSGNFDRNDIIDKFSQFCPNPQGTIVKVDQFLTPFKPLPQNKLVAVKKDLSTGWLIMGWAAPGMTNLKDYASLQVIDTILGGGMSSRLFSDLREKQGLAYEISSIYSSRMDNTSFAMYIGTKPENLFLAKNQFLQEINKIKTESISEKELNDAKQQIIGQYILSQETNGEKAHVLGWYEVIGKDYTFNNKYSDLINSVTIQDVRETAKKYFSNPYLISVIGPEKSVKTMKKEQTSESKR